MHNRRLYHILLKWGWLGPVTIWELTPALLCTISEPVTLSVVGMHYQETSVNEVHLLSALEGMFGELHVCFKDLTGILIREFGIEVAHCPVPSLMHTA